MYSSPNLAIYAIKLTKLEVNINLVVLQPGSSQLISENDFIMKYEVEQSSMYLSSFIVIHYYLEGDVDVAHYITKNAVFNAEIKMPQSCFIFFKMLFSNQ